MSAAFLQRTVGATQAIRINGARQSRRYDFIYFSAPSCLKMSTLNGGSARLAEYD